jgi:hypothetical protein
MWCTYTYDVHYDVLKHIFEHIYKLYYIHNICIHFEYIVNGLDRQSKQLIK